MGDLRLHTHGSPFVVNIALRCELRSGGELRAASGSYEREAVRGAGD
jgi:hypothetical protein